ncbi:hypothetical protein BH18VER1_BH18VER1_15070 [soil metagenome]
MKPDLVSGSPQWQTIFVSFALVLVLFEIVRGWRAGLPRQLVRVAAVVAAYATALFGGRLLLPILRPVLKVPDLLISMVAGAVLALIVYSAISAVGSLLFKRTAQQEGRTIRWIYGASGAFVGLFFGAFLLWLLVVGMRSVGAVAEAQVNAMAPAKVEPFIERPTRSAAPVRQTRTAVPDENSLVMSLARLKKSIELGSVGDVVKQTDVLPGGMYTTLGRVGEVFARPQSAQRFLSYPGVQELADSPKILALRADPAIARMISEGRLFELLQDERLIEAANDPELAAQLKRFDFKAALDHAARKQ